jgi:hypothetical protein
LCRTIKCLCADDHEVLDLMVRATVGKQCGDRKSEAIKVRKAKS